MAQLTDNSHFRTTKFMRHIYTIVIGFSLFTQLQNGGGFPFNPTFNYLHHNLELC